MSLSDITSQPNRQTLETLTEMVQNYNDQLTAMLSNLTTEANGISGGGFKIISDDVRNLFELLNFTLLLGTFSFFGIIGNVINLVVFLKQGFSDSVNISLFALSISDIGCLITMLWQSICYNRWFAKSPLVPFDSLEVQYLTGGWPHICFARITTWITLFITVERCLCITIPLKVKRVITHRRTVIIIAAIYVIMIGSIAPVYVTSRFGDKFDPVYNRTIIGLVYISDREKIDSISFAVNNVFVQLLSFTGIIIFTLVLVVKLKSKTKWRDANAQSKATGNQEATSASVRDRKIVKMVTFISSAFIVCFFPVTVIFVGMIVEPRFNIGAQFQNLHFFLCSFTFVMECISSSINIFIYYNMSTKYRNHFRAMLCKNKSKNVATN